MALSGHDGGNGVHVAGDRRFGHGPRPLAAASYPTLLTVSCMGIATVVRDQLAPLGLLIPSSFLVTPSCS